MTGEEVDQGEFQMLLWLSLTLSLQEHLSELTGP